MFQTLISAERLRELQTGATPALLLDCRFQLADPAYGARVRRWPPARRALPAPR